MSGQLCTCGSTCSYYVVKCDGCRHWYFFSCHQLTVEMVKKMKCFYCRPCREFYPHREIVYKKTPEERGALYKLRLCDMKRTDHKFHRYQATTDPIRCICDVSCISKSIQCAFCGRWMHYECISYTEEIATTVNDYYCPPCRDANPNLQITYKKQTLARPKAIQQSRTILLGAPVTKRKSDESAQQPAPKQQAVCTELYLVKTQRGSSLKYIVTPRQPSKSAGTDDGASCSASGSSLASLNIPSLSPVSVKETPTLDASSAPDVALPGSSQASQTAGNNEDKSVPQMLEDLFADTNDLQQTVDRQGRQLTEARRAIAVKEKSITEKETIIAGLKDALAKAQADKTAEEYAARQQVALLRAESEEKGRRIVRLEASVSSLNAQLQSVKEKLNGWYTQRFGRAT